MIYVDGYKIVSAIIPPVLPGVGGSRIGFTGDIPAALDAEGGSSLTQTFNGTGPDDDNFAALQGTLNGTLVPGGIYRVWLKARETGSGASNPAPGAVLMDSLGLEKASSQVFWPSNGLTSTLTWYSVTMTMRSGQDGEFAQNSLGIWLYAPEQATKVLELDCLRVEEIAVG